MPKNTKEKTLYYKRVFLNRPRRHAGAFVIAELTEDRWKYKDNKGKEHEQLRLDALLEISDCNRHISLSLDTGSKRDRANTIHKLNVLISVLTNLRDTLETWFNEHSKSTDY